MLNLKINIGLIFIALVFLAGCKKEEVMIRTGQVEMREYDVASKVPGRIAGITVDEGDSINIGQELFRLTDRELKAKVGQAEGAVQSASALYKMSLKGTRAEQIQMAERSYLAAKSQFELAEKTYNRLTSLHSDKLISDQEMDVASQRLSAAKSAMEAASAQFDMARNGARDEEKQAALGQFDKAKQSLEETQSYLDETIIKSYYKGIIAKRFVNEGELVSIGYSVLIIIDPEDSWVELNLPETEMRKLKIGTIIKGKINSLDIEESFKVINYSVLSDFANWRSTGDKSTYDVRSFTIKLKPNNKIGSLRPGMTVSFDLNHI